MVDDLRFFDYITIRVPKSRSKMEQQMSSYRVYVDQAISNLQSAAEHASESDADANRQIALANAQVFALLAVAEAILAAGGQTDWTD